MPLLAWCITGILTLAAAAFVGGALMWLKNLRGQLALSVRDTLSRQINHGQKVEEALNHLQRNQRQMEAQLRTLSEAQARARTDINVLRERLGGRDPASETGAGHGRVLH